MDVQQWHRLAGRAAATGPEMDVWPSCRFGLANRSEAVHNPISASEDPKCSGICGISVGFQLSSMSLNFTLRVRHVRSVSPVWKRLSERIAGFQILRFGRSQVFLNSRSVQTDTFFSSKTGENSKSWNPAVNPFRRSRVWIWAQCRISCMVRWRRILRGVSMIL